MQDNVRPEYCSVCRKPVSGGFDVLDSVPADYQKWYTIAIVETPERDFIVCDLCSDAVHFRCSKHSASGYCDYCFEKYDLVDPTRSPYGLHER